MVAGVFRAHAALHSGISAAKIVCLIACLYKDETSMVSDSVLLIMFLHVIRSLTLLSVPCIKLYSIFYDVGSTTTEHSIPRTAVILSY